MRRLAGALVVLALAGCGGERAQTRPQQPRLPHDLAAAWAARSDQVAGALAEGDGCTAQRLATSLQSDFIAAVNAGRVPRRLQEPLGAAFNDLQGRIACVPPQPVSGKPRKHEQHEKHEKHEKPKHGHGKPHKGHR
jgi:hypothetical protein